MENVTINPENYKSEYLRNLNECFNGWGKEREYDWVFNRVVGDKKADIMLISNEEGEVIAGSAVTYRKIRKPDGDVMDIAIMTGSWTLPKARGKGCFSKIITLSKEVAHQNNVPYLTAFVTETNASFRRLANAGASLVPTAHLFSPEEPYANADTSTIKVIKEEDEELFAAIYDRFKTLQQHKVSFSYTQDEFHQQYLERPKKTEVLKIEDNFVLIEETYNAVKVLLLTHDDVATFERIIQALTNWALQNRSKKVLFFSTEREIIETSEKLGFQSLKGYYTILSTAPEVGTEVNTPLMQVTIHSGDKM